MFPEATRKAADVTCGSGSATFSIRQWWRSYSRQSVGMVVQRNVAIIKEFTHTWCHSASLTLYLIATICESFIVNFPLVGLGERPILDLVGFSCENSKFSESLWQVIRDTLPTYDASLLAIY